MEASIQAVVARFNNKPISVEAINDDYTSVQVVLKLSDLDDETIEVLKNDRFVNVSEQSVNLGEMEAKDYSNINDKLTIKIEFFSITVT